MNVKNLKNRNLLVLLCLLTTVNQALRSQTAGKKKTITPLNRCVVVMR
jgi:hypothetical protein